MKARIAYENSQNYVIDIVVTVFNKWFLSIFVYVFFAHAKLVIYLS